MVKKPSILQRAVNAVWYATHPDAQPSGPAYHSVDDLDPWTYAGQTQFAGFENSIFDGGKFAGGFGNTQIQWTDYWTLRARSAQLFNENLYARGLIRRLITNEINTGLAPECAPDEEVLGLEEDSLNDWSEQVENRFGLWCKSPKVCDWKREATFGAIQRAARLEALVCGDVLVVLRQNPRTRLPMVQLVSGNSVHTPIGNDTPRLRQGHEILHGVEFDAQGRQVAFHVQQKDGSYKRVPAYGEKSGRRLAWLVYGTDRRLDDVRGQPLLSIVLQSLKEIDRYRDSAQRKAVINSIMAMFIKKGEDKPGTLPMTGGAVRRDRVEVSDNTTKGTPRQFNIANQIPGLVIEELQHGEEPVVKGGEGTDVNFGTFEEAIIQAVAWANEVPPEILRLAFSNNYSASQAAINEFKIYINRVWADWGETFCTPIYQEWLISENLLSRIVAPGLLDAWRDPMKHDQLAAWVSVDWYGSIKPSTDMLKQAKGSKMLVDEGWSTNAREARITTGTKFSHNMKRLKRENAQKAEAARPLLELQREFGIERADATVQAIEDAVVQAVEDSRETG
jgi:capsid protein